jgi:hypothetical protein
MGFRLTADGSLLDDDRVVYLSIPRFVEEVCHNGHCFVCGSAPDGAAFEQEHVLPDWLLRKHKLHDVKIGLPGGAGLTYPRYKVPCCAVCNRNMGRLLEEPVSALLSGGFAGLRSRFDPGVGGILYAWLSLIFFKTHYKDLFLKRDLKKPLEGNRIADHYELEELHHIHCMARACYTRPAVDSAAIGSLFILHAASAPYYDEFDYVDMHEARTILVRSGDIALIGVLNDANICQRYLGSLLSRVTGSLSPVQLREVFAHASAINIALPNRPTFRSRVSGEGVYEIHADIPENPDVIRFDGEERLGFGKILEFALLPYLNLRSSSHSAEEIRRHIGLGQMTYLFNDDGSFREDSLVLLDTDEGTQS